MWTVSGRASVAHLDARDHARAIPLLEAILPAMERVLGPEANATDRARSYLAGGYGLADRWADAIPLLEESRAYRQRVKGPRNPRTLVTEASLTTAYEAVGRLDLAIPLLTSVVATREQVLGPDDPTTAQSRDRLARWQQRRP